MFKEMRRKDKQISDEKDIELLRKCNYGVLSTTGEDGYAYGVPLSYTYVDNSLYFHSAIWGHKLDNIKNNDKVSFCVVGEVENIPDEFNTKYESAIVFGKAFEVDGDEKYSALIAILEKYSNEYMEKGKKYIESEYNNAKVVKISIEHITGKMGN